MSILLLLSTVLFIGGVVGATVETIDVDSDQAPHSFGAVTRWMVMYLHIMYCVCVCVSGRGQGLCSYFLSVLGEASLFCWSLFLFLEVQDIHYLPYSVSCLYHLP